MRCREAVQRRQRLSVDGLDPADPLSAQLQSASLPGGGKAQRKREPIPLALILCGYDFIVRNWV